MNPAPQRPQGRETSGPEQKAKSTEGIVNRLLHGDCSGGVGGGNSNGTGNAQPEESVQFLLGKKTGAKAHLVTRSQTLQPGERPARGPSSGLWQFM